MYKNGKSPLRKVGELDNRGSHFYLALYWAEELSKQKDDLELSSIFNVIFQQMLDKEKSILLEINNSQGMSKDIEGYYFPDPNAVSKIMRPSKIFNKIIDNI